MLNKVELIGRIIYNDIELKGSEGKEFCAFNIGVQKDYKPEGEKYYPEDAIICKAFKHTAKFIAEHFKQGDYIVIAGRLSKDENYEKDGKTVYGGLFVNVENVYFVPSKATGTDNKSDGNSDTSEPPKKKIKPLVKKDITSDLPF